jgi:hypothetical protein
MGNERKKGVAYPLEIEKNHNQWGHGKIRISAPCTYQNEYDHTGKILPRSRFILPQGSIL